VALPLVEEVLGELKRIGRKDLQLLLGINIIEIYLAI
jgi:hypothetical protein